jgi:hypothetical protein
VITDTLPDDLNYVTFQSSVSTTATVAGNDVIFNLQFGTSAVNAGLPRNETALVTMSTIVDSQAISGTVTNSAVVGGTGLDIMLNNNSDSVPFLITVEQILDFMNFMPVMMKK